MHKDDLPNDRYEVRRLSLSAFRANILGLFLPIPLALLYIVIYRASFPLISHIRIPSLPFDKRFHVPAYVLIFLGVLAVLILTHELIHAFFFLLSARGKKNSTRIKSRMLAPYAYCTEALPLGLYRLSLIAPIPLLIVPFAFISLLFGDPLTFLLTLIMIFSTGGDLTAIWTIRMFNRKGSLILDDPIQTACEVFIPK